jgi:hypothetical protein
VANLAEQFAEELVAQLAGGSFDADPGARRVLRDIRNR